MLSLNFVNLIQSATVSVALLGTILLWRAAEFRAMACFLALNAIAAFTNILEESGLTRDIYLLSPVFITMFAPASYLATMNLIKMETNHRYLWHFLPVLPLFFFTHHVQVLIAIGTVWRLAYTFLTVNKLIKYQKLLNEKRSDALDLSLSWLLWLLVVTAGFTLFDLVRLNAQPLLTHELNVAGQAVNNTFWLLMIILLVIKLNNRPLNQQSIAVTEPSNESVIIENENKQEENSAWQAIFQELDKNIKAEQWYRQPRLTLNQLCSLTGIQTRDISRAINLTANQSFNEYINRLRTDFVCEQLQNKPDKNISVIADEAGFSSKTSFNKSFKQFIGLTPGEYKKQTC